MQKSTYNCNYIITKEESKKCLFSTKMSFPIFEGLNLMNKITIPFNLRVPKKVYPSCIFDSNSFVLHYLIIDFPSIKAKKQ